jgi:plastocyanin
MMRRTWAFAGIALVSVIAAVVLSATVLMPVAAAKPAVKTVAIKNMTFMPKKITITAGTKVTWINRDSVQHTVTSTKSLGLNTKVTKKFDSGLFGKGKKFSFTFKKKGTYFYECTIHAFMPSMHGQVTVK